MARVKAEVNGSGAEIGPRRLQIGLEKLLDDLAFDRPDACPTKVITDQAFAHDSKAGIAANPDVSRFILRWNQQT